eukprot:m.176580 g.176580  ORF g.176580 m.176580 type:complete len:348 (+) comp14628_c4_seq1:334-1377(+)
MAKWGEGDPRWIVEERADTANVNNWHWTEKNALPWSKQFLMQHLDGLKVEGPAGAVTFHDVTVEGDASANNRKGKLIFFYELVVKFKWKGKATDGTVVKGSATVPNLSEENDIDEVELDTTLTGDATPAKRAVKELVRKQGHKEVLKVLQQWHTDLRTEFTKGMILPTKDAKKAPEAPAPAQTTGVKIHSHKKVEASAASTSSVESADKPAYTKFTLRDEFRCAPQDLFRALVDADMIKAYTQADASVDSKVGGAFSLFGGNVTGTITDLIPFERVTQMWRFSSWPENHYSTVTMKLTEGNGSTFLHLEHSNVPVSDLERTKGGWQQHQFQRMKGMFGWGASLGGMF